MIICYIPPIINVCNVLLIDILLLNYNKLRNVIENALYNSSGYLLSMCDVIEPLKSLDFLKAYTNKGILINKIECNDLILSLL